jgi:hypothetical protein
MATIYNVFVFSAANLLDGAGRPAMGVADNNGLLLGKPPYIHGGGGVQRVPILEADTGAPPGNSAGQFDDGTDAQQYLTEPLTLEYRSDRGLVLKRSFPPKTVVQSEFIIVLDSGYRITGLRLTDPTNGQLYTAGYVLIRPDGRLVTEPGAIKLGTPVRNASDGTQPWSAVACFAPATRIRVPGGWAQAGALRPGDRVETLDRGPMPVEWAGRFVVPRGGEGPGLHPADPVDIPAGVLGAQRRLRLSPQHRVLLRHPLAEILTGSPEGLAAAVHLAGQGGIARRPSPGPVHYAHFRLAAHALVEADGVWCETLWGETDLRLDLGAYLGSDPLPPFRAEPLVRPALRRAEAALVLDAILRAGRMAGMGAAVA